MGGVRSGVWRRTAKAVGAIAVTLGWMSACGGGKSEETPLAPPTDAAPSQGDAGPLRPLDVLFVVERLEDWSPAVGPWNGVKDAIGRFVADPASAELGVGLQTFPITHAGAGVCESTADCTVGGVSLGRCTARECNDGYICDTNADCASGPCHRRGICPNGAHPGLLPASTCDYDLVGGMFCPPGGTCGLASGACDGDVCVDEDYAIPVVPIVALTGNVGAVASNIAALRGFPRPTGPGGPYQPGTTPTGVAIRAALSYARARVSAQPERDVVLVLLAANWPNRCAPVDEAGFGALIGSGLTTSPTIRTFVVGLVDYAPLTKLLDELAVAGGTEKARIVPFKSSTPNTLADELAGALAAISRSARRH